MCLKKKNVIPSSSSFLLITLKLIVNYAIGHTGDYGFLHPFFCFTEPIHPIRCCPQIASFVLRHFRLYHTCCQLLLYAAPNPE